MFRVMDGAGDGIPGVFVDQMADRLLVSTRGCSIPANLESELRDTGMPVSHKKLERNQKETFWTSWFSVAALFPFGTMTS